MKTNFILLTTTIVFALLTITFGYQGLLMNYQGWICWDSCVWETFEDCEEICKDAVPEKRIELTREEQKEKSLKLREMYNPIFDEYDDSVGIPAGGIFSRGHGYSHPESLEDNLEANFDYSDGVFTHFEQAEIVSPLQQTDDAGKIIILKEMLFPEMHVFWLFIIAIGVLVGFKMRK